jgi:hypothetical protein
MSKHTDSKLTGTHTWWRRSSNLTRASPPTSVRKKMTSACISSIVKLYISITFLCKESMRGMKIFRGKSYLSCLWGSNTANHLTWKCAKTSFCSQCNNIQATLILSTRVLVYELSRNLHYMLLVSTLYLMFS